MRPPVKEEELEAQDFSLRRNEERESVITFPGITRTIKVEPDVMPAMIDVRLDSPAELRPQNLSLKRGSSEEMETSDDGQYVHKKFRTNVERSEEEESVARSGSAQCAQLPRRSVIMHARQARV